MTTMEKGPKLVPEWFWRYEALPWLISVVWVAGCVCACLWFGPPFDWNARMSVDDLSDIATVASGIMAPVAVLWVVRSIHVQKTELASAVRAANEQTRNLAEQNAISTAHFEHEISPSVDLQVSQAFISGPRGTWEKFYFTFRNLGRGSANSLYLDLTGWSADTQETFRKRILVKRDLAPGQEYQHIHEEHVNDRPRTAVLDVQFECERSDQKQMVRRWAYQAGSNELLERGG